MAITSSNVLVIYRDGDADSEALADAYVDLYSLDSNQKKSIACSSAEVLSDESTFNSQVLNPVKSAINTTELAGFTIYAILLCYSVPGGYIDGDDIISSTSRISRINYSFSKQTKNILFDRKSFKLFDSVDSDFALICTRIDGPSLETAKKMVDNAEILKNQLFINGKFYLDAFSDRQGSFAQEYENALLSFETRLLPSLNLDTFSTTFLDPYIDALIPRVTNDSIVWSWFTDRGSPDFFNDSNAIRFLGYNADYDGAETVRSFTDRRWPSLFIQNDYVATAGSMSNPGNDGFLFPYPFFITLLRGGTLGEAFLFSQPFLDWTISVFGDPLATVAFPALLNTTEEEEIEETESWRLMFNDLARSVAYFLRKTDSYEDVFNKVILSDNVPTTVDLLESSRNLLNANGDDQRRAQYYEVVNALVKHIVDRYVYVNFTLPKPTFDAYLSITGNKISELVYDVQIDDNLVTAENLYPQGYWEVEQAILERTDDFAFYHFELQISDSDDFSNIILEKKSIEDQSNWFYEKEKNEYEQIPLSGVPSNFVTRRVKYESKEVEYLTRAEIYYYRLRQRDQNTFYSYITWTDIIYT